MKTLIANNCGIDDISMLSSLTNLTNLQLNNNDITNISALSALNKLKTLKLRGNFITDYTPVQLFYTQITTKDFSVTNKNDVVVWMPNISADGKIGTAYAKMTATKPSYVYYSFEKYDSAGKLQKRSRTSYSAYSSQQTLTVPEVIYNDDGSYVVIKAYERSDYRQLLAEAMVKSKVFNLSAFN